MDVRQPSVAAADAKWSKDTFQFLFVSMGQGDCCVITCPDGRHVMIDCGSKAEESDSSWDVIAELLRGPDVFGLVGAERGLEALILTHPDKDHVSKVAELLGAKRMGFSYGVDADAPSGVSTKRPRPAKEFKRITVNNVYFSDPSRARDDFKRSPLRQYAITACNDAIYQHLKVQKLYCVTLNSEAAKVDVWTKPSAEAIVNQRQPFAEQDHSERVIDRSGLVICEGRAGNGTDWSIKIIAGNVPKDPNEVDTSDQDGRNAGSLVTLIKFGVEKFLICGDATVSTEKYLIRNYPSPKDLESLTLIQVPHHGSNTSFSSDFIDGCRYSVNGRDTIFGGAKPKQAIVSVQLLEHAHHLPTFNMVTRAKNHAKVYPAHRIHYWKEITAVDFERLKSEWASGAVTFITESDNQMRPARYVRHPIAENFNGIIVLDGLNSPGNAMKYALYQEVSTQEIRLTGIDGHIWYYFDGTG